MLRPSISVSLGVLLGVTLSARVDAQMVGRSSGGTISRVGGSISAPRISSQPPVVMRSPPVWGTAHGRFGKDFGRFDGRFGHVGRGKAFVGSCLNGFCGRSWLWDVGYAADTYVPYAVPYYVPVPVATYQPVAPAPNPAPPREPYDPTKSRMLTIGAGADGGGGVMRIERVDDRTLRLTWRGTTQAVREAKLFLADSTQRTLRSARVDAESPSALFEIQGLEPKIAYTGLTVVFADGSVQTTLVPYQQREEPKP
jgi:hypothetical protein